MDQVDNFGRKVWNKKFHKQNEELKDKSTNKVNSERIVKHRIDKMPKEEIKNKREYYLNISKNIGISKTFKDPNDKKGISGYWCEVCQLSFNDSHSWIRHLNSQRHNQKFGGTLYIEKKSLESVRTRLNELIEKHDKNQNPNIKNSHQSDDSNDESCEDYCTNDNNSELAKYNLPKSFS